MTQTAPQSHQEISLVEEPARIAFIREVLTEQVQLSARMDWVQHLDLLARGLAQAVGERRGPYRDPDLRNDAVTRLAFTALGVMIGIGEEQPDRAILQNWAAAVVGRINANYAREYELLAGTRQDPIDPFAFVSFRTAA